MAGRKKKVVETVEVGSLAEEFGLEPYVPPVEVETKVAKLSPFDFINAIGYTKERLITDTETENQYQPYIVNRGLSNSMDTVIYANEMNSRPHIEKAMQFEFLRRVVPKRKRYDKWVKVEEVEDIELVKEYYGYSDRKALEALSILTPVQIELIKKKLNKGGLQA